MNHYRKLDDEMLRRYNKQISQLGRFFSVGVVSTSVHYISMIGAVELLEASPIHASSSGYVAGAIISYILNYKFTFGSNRSHLDAGLRFVLANSAGFLLNAAIVGIGTNLFNANYLITQVFSTIVVFFFNFIIGKFWTYKSV